MPETHSRGLLISDFNLSTLAGYLDNDPHPPALHTSQAPFGQALPLLLDAGQTLWNEADFAILWTQPQAVIESFRHALSFQPVATADVLAEVEAYGGAVLGLSDRVAFTLVPSWLLPSYQRGLGLLDRKHPAGLSLMLDRMNIRLAERLAEAPNIFLLDARRWVEAAGKTAFSPKLWHMSKTPFGHAVFKAAVSDIKAAVNGLTGQARKLIVLDLDNTLWGGVAAEIGWENVQLGGHDPIGEAFVEFQAALKSLQNRGILLALASKNREEAAMAAITQHPEMLLRPDDFVAWRINWNDKAQSVAEIAAELNLGLQSVVFIDDSPAERARVQETLPEVLVPEWPGDRMLYASALLSLPCFDTPSISQEDRERTNLYMAERQRQRLQTSIGSVADWLRTLDIHVHAELLSEVNLARTAQLLNKTNQMNLSTRRLTEAELRSWAEQPGHILWAFRVSDRFGDAGLTGIASLEIIGERAEIVDFVLSCRVFGRQIEETMVHVLAARARSLGLGELRATYLPTSKNQPCLEFWQQRSGFVETTAHRFVWHLTQPYPPPNFITLTGA